MNNIVSFQRHIYILVCPIYNLFKRRDCPPDGLLSLSIIVRQLQVSGYVMLIHPLLNWWLLCITLLLYLVSSKMGIAVNESWVDFFHNISDNIVCGVYGWIKLSLISIIASDNYILVQSWSSPTLRMCGSVYLGDNPHSSDPSIVNDRFYLSSRVCAW